MGGGTMTRDAIEPGLRVRLADPYDGTIEKVTAALKEQGFGVITTIDVKETLKQKLDVDFRRYAILGACNPSFAHQALSTDLEIGLYLPCNVIVYEEDDGGGTVVSIVDPVNMMGPTMSPGLEPIASGVRARLEAVAAALRGAAG